MARTQGDPEEPPELGTLLSQGIPRDRALLAVGIGRLRFAKSWTHHTLGKRAGGISGTYLRRVEEGTHSLTVDRLVRVAQALEVSSIEQLFGFFPTEPLLKPPEAAGP